MTATPTPKYAEGHRQRLKERFLKVGHEGLADYELIELLLFYTRPRVDVKPTAKELLHKFGTFSELITADPRDILTVPGTGENTITLFKIVRAAAHKLAQEQILNRPVLSSWRQVIEYCRISLGHDKIECFHILFLDHKNNLIADEKQQQGTVDRTPIYPREVVKRALELNAGSLILVHNHPSGDPTPSRADIELTDQVVEAARPLGVRVHDHIIISKTGHSSLKNMGVI